MKNLKVLTIPPPSLLGNPNIMVAFINLFKTPVIFRRILNMIPKTKIHIRKAIPS